MTGARPGVTLASGWRGQYEKMDKFNVLEKGSL
jgi:hypothetical protein